MWLSSPMFDEIAQICWFNIFNVQYVQCRPHRQRIVLCASRIKNWDDTFGYASTHNGGRSVAMRSLADAYAYRCVDVRNIPQQVAVGHHKPVTMFASLPVNATFCPVCVVFQTTAVTSASLCLLAHSFSSRLLDVPLLESYSEIQTHYTV